MAVVHPGLVDRAKNILVTPKTEWPAIDAEPASIADIYRSYVLWLAAIPPIAGFIGNALFGYSVLGVPFRVPLVAALGSAIAQYLLSLISVFVLALIIDALAPTFGGAKNQVQAFKVAAYSNTAGWVAGILTVVPQLGTIAAILSLYAFYLLYLGLPLLMHAPKEKALGYTIASVVAAIVLIIVISAVLGTVGSMFAPAIPAGTTVL
jgi:hypothetical protein